MSEGLLIEYLRRDGSPLQLIDLGVDALTKLGVPLAKAHRPFRVEAEAKQSKKGNVYFDYTQSGIALPDGLNTGLRVGGVELVMEDERSSQAGNPLRQGTTVIDVNRTPYEVTSFITRMKSGAAYWVKVHAHKKTAPARATRLPSIMGGDLV